MTRVFAMMEKSYYIPCAHGPISVTKLRLSSICKASSGRTVAAARNAAAWTARAAEFGEDQARRAATLRKVVKHEPVEKPGAAD